VEYLDWELNPGKGKNGVEEDGMFIAKEEWLLNMFKRFSGEEDLLLCGSLACFSLISSS
jgi:hypothetical protein